MGFMDSIKNAASRKQRYIPVILLLDVSGSMDGEKIDSLNEGVKLLLDECANPKFEKPVKLAIITFGKNDRAELHQEMDKARTILENWKPMEAYGMTPLGDALKMALAMVDDVEYLPKDEYYKGYFVLASDGEPNDSWEEPLRLLIEHGRAGKYERNAIAIGDDADEIMLDSFKSPETPLYHARDGKAIVEAFKKISESVSNKASGMAGAKKETPRAEKASASAKANEDDDDGGFI